MNCSIKDCKAPKFCKDMCTKHYQRARAHGSPYITKRREDGQGTIHKGYKEITVDGKQMPEHRHVMEVALGRKLKQSEHIHHINGDRLDNRLENLKVVTPQEHTPIHKIGRYWHEGTSYTHKYCPKCKTVKSRTEFHKTKSPSWCIICTRHSQHHFVESCPLCLNTL